MLPLTHIIHTGTVKNTATDHLHLKIGVPSDHHRGAHLKDEHGPVKAQGPLKMAATVYMHVCIHTQMCIHTYIIYICV